MDVFRLRAPPFARSKSSVFRIDASDLRDPGINSLSLDRAVASEHASRSVETSCARSADSTMRARLMDRLRSRQIVRAEERGPRTSGLRTHPYRRGHRSDCFGRQPSQFGVVAGVLALPRNVYSASQK